jgi:hypothetical protein
VLGTFILLSVLPNSNSSRICLNSSSHVILFARTLSKMTSETLNDFKEPCYESDDFHVCSLLGCASPALPSAVVLVWAYRHHQRYLGTFFSDPTFSNHCANKVPSNHSERPTVSITTTTMKSPAQTQSTTATNPLTLRNSILPESFSSHVECPVPPITRTNNYSESEAVQQRRSLRMILNSAIALLDGADDVDPSMDSSTTHKPPLQ